MPEASTLLLTTSHSAEVRIVSQHCATYAVRGTHIPKMSLFCLRTNARNAANRVWASELPLAISPMLLAGGRDRPWKKVLHVLYRCYLSPVSICGPIPSTMIMSLFRSRKVSLHIAGQNATLTRAFRGHRLRKISICLHFNHHGPNR
jgi:hypothetical protein